MIPDDSNSSRKVDNDNAMSVSSGSDTERVLDNRLHSNNYFNGTYSLLSIINMDELDRTEVSV